MATLRPDALKIARNDRAFFCGATGSGKTTLAKALLWGQRHVIVLDPKRDFFLPQAAGAVTIDLARNPDKARQFVLDWEGPGPLIIQPGLEILNEPFALDWVFEWVFGRRNTLIYVDEASTITNGANIGKGHAACIQLGRSRGIGTWHATQRPVNVPRVLLTEAEHIFRFRLRHPADQQRIADVSDPVTLSREPEPQQFWYYNDKAKAGHKLRFYARANVGKVLSNG